MTFIDAPATRPAPRAAATHRRVRPVVLAALAIIMALAGGVLGWTVAGDRSARHAATASLVINPLPGTAFFDESTADIVILQTEAERVHSDAVLSGVVSQLGTIDDELVLRRRSSVVVTPGSEVLKVTYRGGSADASTAVVEALAKETLQDRRQRASSFVNAQIEGLKQDIRTSRRALSRATDASERQVLSRRKVLLTRQLNDLQDLSLKPGAVIGVSTVREANKKVQVVLTAAGATVGLICGLWVAVWVSRRSRRVP